MRFERKYWPVWVLVLAMFFAWSAWGMVLHNTSPFASPAIALPLFYLTSFFVAGITLAAFSALLRVAFMPKQTVAEHINAALRQGVIFGTAALCLALFQQYRIMTWWTAVMIIAIGILIEAFFWSADDEPAEAEDRP
jgi:uncharacterized membrane protein